MFGSTALAAVLLWPSDGGGGGAGAAATSRASGGERTAPESLAAREALVPAAAREEAPAAGGGPPSAVAAPVLDPAQVEAYAVGPAPSPASVQPRLGQPPAAGILFDVDSGEVLWARRPAEQRPIASLTKMMTALLIAERHGPGEMVAIGAKAPGVEGSRIGVLRTGAKVPLRALFLGLLMVSGNDAAVALAEHHAGSVEGFVRRMNARATEMGLGCTRFAGPAGLQDTGNASCAYDLAALARADLADDWIASVTSRRSASVPFPIKGGRLDLANNHYFVQRGVAGLPGARVTGVKTGETNGAGRCYVTTARLGERHLGVVLLDSPDPLRQVPLLLRAGFRAGA